MKGRGVFTQAPREAGVRDDVRKSCVSLKHLTHVASIRDSLRQRARRTQLTRSPLGVTD